ncbi:MAG: class I SAM-dependent methyltransferase [Dehalococcoidia bacterium]|nr:class I SAM-dependent methyltransferase [Dehalococcoidia bacterium]
MMRSSVTLGDVSKTAIATLRCRAVESAKPRPLLRDTMAEDCVIRLSQLMAGEEHLLLFERKLSPVLVNYIVLRARKYDAIANSFVLNNPSSLVVNLGCGFDTRYWRIDRGDCEYVELDLPEVVALKREVFAERLSYRMIGASVLDPAWMDMVNPGGKRRCLLLAEGLFMYLPRQEVISLFRTVSERFRYSRMALEVATQRYTRGVLKKVTVMKMRRQLGYDAGSSYQFGVRDAREFESFAPGLALLDEWSYVEDPDVRPRILRHIGIARTQWTVVLGINERG